MKDFSFRSVVRASNDLVSSTSNLNNHRALRQIFVYAAQKKHSAVEVISDAFTGGIVASFRDRNSRILNAVLLPSPKSMAALAPLIASGFFVPSSSRSTESTFEVWTPLSECMWRDAFTMTVLLFPDCFADGVQSASDEEDEGYYSLRVRQAEKSPVPSSSTASLSYVVENSEANHHRSHNTPVRDSPSLSRQPSEGQANPTTTPRHLTTCSMASMSGLTTMSGGEVPSMASADVVGMHAIRLQTAVQLLSTLNDALHDVQCRLMALDYQGGTSSSPASGSSTWAPRSSRACLNEMSGCLMRTKMLLLCCVAATEAAYRPHSAMPAPGELVKHEEHPWVLPRQTLMELVGELCNDPIERWPCGTVQETEEWYDALLERLSATYLTIDGRLCASFDAFVQSIAWDGQHGARQLTRLPKMVLNRPNDGKPAVVLGIHHHLPRPKLPVMPLQAGELQFLTRSADGVLLFDGAPSPVADFFRLCSTSRWSDAQAEEVNHFLATPFASYTHPEQIIIRNLLCRDSYLEQFLSTNASVLARVVMWVGDATASGTADSLIATMAKEMISNVQQIVLLRCKFSVCVVQYLHELLSSSRLDKDTFLQWIDHCCAHTADVRSHIAVIDALVDFAAARQEWQLEGDLRLRFAELKLQRT